MGNLSNAASLGKTKYPELTALSFLVSQPDTALFFFPYPTSTKALSFPAGWKPTVLGEPIDAILLTDLVDEDELIRLLNDVPDPLVSVISLVPGNERLTDSVSTGPAAWERAKTIRARADQIAGSVRRSTLMADMLLCRLFSRETRLDPEYDSAGREFVRYPAAGPLINMPEMAHQLYRQGYLTRHFFDRIHVCPDCGSARISVREECPTCRSSDIHEKPTINHFMCGHLAPESEFRTGSRFECPKCGGGLRHIGLDYDKPGSVLCCNACGGVSDLAVVGFKCIDCGAHHDTEQVPRKDYYSFRLTSLAIQYLVKGVSPKPNAHGGLDVFSVLLEQSIRQNREFKTAFAVVHLCFINGAAIRARNLRLWDMTLNLIHDVLHSALRATDAFHQVDEDNFLVLLPHADRAAATEHVRFIAKRLGTVLKVDPGLRCDVLDPIRIRALRSWLE
jgi:hypothetical protein